MITLTEQSLFFGRARVLRREQGRVLLEMGERGAWAGLALGLPLTPGEGDLVIAVGHEEECYVVGVLESRGTCVLRVPGDLRITAPRGKIELAARDGITLKSPLLRFLARGLEVTARSLVERLGRAHRFVRDLLWSRAGRADTRVEGTHRLQADRIAHRARGDVKIDGRRIHLG